MVFNVKIQPYSSRRRQKKSEERRRRSSKKKICKKSRMRVCFKILVRVSLSLSLSLSLSMKFSVFFVRRFWTPFFEQVVFALVVLAKPSVRDVFPVVKRRFRLFD